MQTDFALFLRHGGLPAASIRLSRKDAAGQEPLASEIPNFERLQANFTDRVASQVNQIAATLIADTRHVFEPPLTLESLNIPASAGSDTLAEWANRLAVIWNEWHVFPERLPAIIAAMEEGLLRAMRGALNETLQRSLGIEQYVWRSQGDALVRPEHATRNGQVFDWDDPPDDGNPSFPFNCRCYAAPYVPFEPDYQPSLGVDYMLAIAGGTARGTAEAVGAVLFDAFAAMVALPGQLWTLGRFVELQIKAALGTLSVQQGAELAAMDAALAGYRDGVVAAFGDLPGLGQAVWEFYAGAIRRVFEMDAAYRRGGATLDQLEQAVADAAFLNTQIGLALVPASFVQGILRRLGKGEAISAGTLADLARATEALRVLSPDPGWQVVRLPGLR